MSKGSDQEGDGAVSVGGAADIACTATLHPDGRLSFDQPERLPAELLATAASLGAADVAAIQAAARMHTPWRGRFELSRGAGIGWFEVLFAVEPAADGTLRCSGFVAEVTDGVRQRAQFERLSLLFRTLSDINKRIPRAISKPGFLDDICRIATAQDCFLLASIHLRGADQRLRVVAAAGRAHGYVEDLVFSADASAPEGVGPAGIALRTGSHVVTNDFLGSARTEPWHGRASSWGIAASVALPLLVGGEAVGVFSVYSDSRDYFDDAALALLDDLAKDISFGLQSIEHADSLAAATRELEASMQRLQAVEAVTNAGSFELQLPSWQIWWSRGAAAVLGLPVDMKPSREALLHASLPEIESILVTSIEAAQEFGAEIDIDIPVQGGRQQVRWVRIFAVVVSVEGGEVKMAGTFQDITARKRMAADLLIAADGERKRLAAEIHDDLGQILTGASLLVAAAVKDSAAGAPQMRVPLLSIGEALAQATAACRNIAHGASATWSGPLVPALRRLVELTRSGQVQCELQCAGNLEPSLAQSQQVDLYRIAQEAITNALKHAKCSRITVSLAQQSGFVELSVADDGVGLRRDGSPLRTGLGLSTMKYRAVRAGGTFAALANPEGGTLVKVLIPRESQLRRVGQ